VASAIPILRGINHLNCHCCVKAKLKHGPKPPRSIRVITVPGECVSFDMTGPFQMTSIHGNRYGLTFIDHFTNTTFNFAVTLKDEFPGFLQQFLIDFRELFKTWKVVELRVLISDNAVFNSAEVQQICRNSGIKGEFPNPRQQFQIGKAEKCIGDVWLMTKTTLLFSNAPRAVWVLLWDEALFNASYVKRHLPTTANEGFKSPTHMPVIRGQQARLSHILPFCSLVYFAVDKQQVSDPKFDPRAQAAVYLGRCSLPDSIDFIQ
jgi:hypothetical protein